jgi:hypothetical protein
MKLVLAVPTCRDTGDALDVVSLLLDYANKGNGASSRGRSGEVSLQKKSVPMHRDMEANGRSPQCCPGRGWLMTPA